MKFDFNNSNFQALLIGIVASLIAAWFIFMLKKSLKSGSGIFKFLKLRAKVETGLELYRKTLEEKTLHITHSWMKEEQTLKDILVPIYFEKGGGTERTELEIFLKNTFRKKKQPRILIIGEPGSGKTIAMRVIANAIWNIEKRVNLLPVLLTFSDIKGTTTEEGFEQKIKENLEYCQFGQGKKNNIPIKTFVENNLYCGKILLLFDGYDELDISARDSISRLINKFLGTHTNIPAIISSRTAVYEKEKPFNVLNPIKINMAPFTPFAILKFITQWKFEGNKSAIELFEMINDRAHLAVLASNPLMLTIISFLYSLPKYTLPDNRVEFYRRCCRALLEEWDTSKNVQRANKFESHQKIAVLNRIAFEHITTAGETDEFVHEDKVHRITKEEMEKLSLKAEEYPQMEKEIVQNSGLLQYIPPTDYRFPHRTFMEFFAASYFDKQKNANDVIELYELDTEKWKEILLLYVGLNENKEYSDFVLEYLKGDFLESTKNQKEKPKILLFNALTECAVPNPELADEILNLAEEFLKRKPIKEMIEELGYIADNPRWAYSKKAKNILLELLSSNIPDEVFQQVIFSLLHTRDKSIDEMIVSNLKRINLVTLLSNMGSRGRYFIHNLFSLELSSKEKRDIIEGLKEAGNFEILGSLLLESEEKDIGELSAYALFRMSKLNGFFDFLDTLDILMLDNETEKLINEKFKDWGWNWESPKKESGKKIAFLICHYTANWILKNFGTINETLSLIEANNWLRYLTTGFLVERGTKFHEFNLISFEHTLASSSGLKRHWKNKINSNNWWYRFSGWVDYEFNPLFLFNNLFVFLLISFLGIVGFAFYIFGLPFNDIYKYLFDNFTVKFFFSQFFTLYLLNSIIFLKYEGYDGDLWFFSAAGYAYVYTIIIGFWDGHKSSLFIRKLFLFICFGLGILCYFLPFHLLLYKIILSLQFFFLIAVTLDNIQVNFRLFNIGNFEEVRMFLEEPYQDILEKRLSVLESGDHVTIVAG